ncbi:MAG: RNA polymerase sigma factor [Chloroflexi bacterium]|nr:RNA polymerase sigma factor [Chloroflexota bacterium]
MDEDLEPDKTQNELWERQTQHQERAAYLRRLQAGDGVVWEQFMAEWNPKLYNYVQYSVRSAEDTKDVLSETWLAIVQAIRNFDGNVAFSTFVYSIVRRKIADYWRGRQVTLEIPEWLSTTGPSDFSMAFYEALGPLSEAERQALMLRYHVGLSVTEVATALDRSYKATESLLSRARQQFQATFMESVKP